MSKLTALRKQIAALEAQAERIAKTEMSSAIARVRDIMSEFNLTIEHLTQAVGGKRPATKTRTKAKAASAAKYADPKTGKTWSGFGRAPGWIAAAKNRDAFLVDQGSSAGSAAKAPAAAKKTAKTGKLARSVAKPAARKAGASGRKSVGAKTTPPAAKKKTAGRKAPAKKRAGAAPEAPTATPAA